MRFLFSTKAQWIGTWIALALSILVCPQLLADDTQTRTADRAAINKVMETQEIAWNHGDVDAFLDGYWRSEELTFSGTSGITRGWENVRARYKTNYPNRAAMGKLDFSQLQFRLLGPDSALVLGHWHLELADKNVGGVFSLVWERFPEGWKIIHDHTSAGATSK